MASRSPVAHFRLANFVTYLAIGAGLTAALETAGPASRSIAGAALAIAALADLFDGRFARLFPRTDEQARFGVQIDSLSDAISFGIAPVVVLARLLPGSSLADRAAFFGCGLVYVLCALTRLAYYNVTESEQTGFVGVPTTLLGIFWSAWLLGAPQPIATCVAMVLGGACMVSPIRIPRPGVKSFIVLTLACLGLAASHIVK